MPIEISEIQVPGLITWFNCFLGFSEIKKRIERVEEKLRSVEFASPILNRRFEFHRTYMDLVIRNRTYRRIDIRKLENTRCLSIIAAIREAEKTLSEVGKGVLRSRLRDALSPDQDMRTLEHELRTFVHYRQAGYDVEFVELEGKERYDFLVHRAGKTFAVECKTFSENLGSAISIEESFRLFRIISDVLKNHPLSQSGIITFEIDNKLDELRSDPKAIILDFLDKAPAQKRYDGVSIAFEKKPTWDIWVSNKNTDYVLAEIQQQSETRNPHFLIALSKQRAIMFCLLSKRNARPVSGIISRLKKASLQLSDKYPGVIWAHMLGINESEFKELHAANPLNGRTPLDIVAHKLLESPKRNHVCRLRLSAESDSVKNSGYRQFLGSPARSISIHGPAYDYTSRVSRFDPTVTEA